MAPKTAKNAKGKAPMETGGEEDATKPAVQLQKETGAEIVRNLLNKQPPRISTPAPNNPFVKWTQWQRGEESTIYWLVD